ncbi:PXA domain-containing protein [Colletotrichum karsti]|uniref:PXA domain-containing protein n=1 Tax=Colletotrichum karsti TaxID=1095194 RepID=A0A9P6LGR5_9PEZI|nr:PXA domain-containing protein [Colletotrichum karsti]KAF9871712.1 PXA domain-containing protein [Colletotrichum karsti]
MTAVATPRAPTPRPKAPATVSFASQTATAVSTPLSTPGIERTRPAIQANPSSRRLARPAPADFLSDKATAAFIRRVLCSQQLSDKGRTTPPPIEELLPPLTSRNDVDLQLYALISVILREYVQAWYSKITPDEAFVDEIVQIIAHCTRALEQRLRKVDLESLLFDELPDLLDRHILAYRAAHDPVSSPPTTIDSREVYHALCPVPPLSPIPRPEDPESVAKQRENEAIYRQLLVQSVLAVLLPTEDLENDCLTSLVGQIFSELIIGNVLANRLSQPWLIYECLIILSRVLERKSEPMEEGVAEAVQAGSAAPLPKQERRSWSIQGAFWSFVHWSFLAFAMIRLLVTTLAMSSSLPPRSQETWSEKHEVTGQISDSKTPDTVSGSEEAQPVKTPIFAFKLWTCISDLMEMDTRMPWLSGMLSMLQLGAMKGPGRVAGLNGTVDRLISHTIHQRILDAGHLPTLLRSIRAALFPNNAPGVSSLVAPSSDEELRALRRRCASALLSRIPPWLARLYLGGRGLGLRWRSGPDSRGGGGHDGTAAAGSDSRDAAEAVATSTSDGDSSGDESGTKSPVDVDEEDQERMLSEIEEGILDVFSDEYCNKHFVYSMLELILVRLMPELAEHGVVELLEERLSL